MNCSRCQGLLCFSELREEAGGLVTEGAPAFRCILCGERIDSVILMNRARGAARSEPYRRPVSVVMKEPLMASILDTIGGGRVGKQGIYERCDHETGGGDLLFLPENPR